MKYSAADVGNWSINWTIRIFPHLEDGVAVCLSAQLQNMADIRRAPAGPMFMFAGMMIIGVTSKTQHQPSRTKTQMCSEAAVANVVPVADSSRTHSHTHRCVFDSSVLKRIASTGVCTRSLVCVCVCVLNLIIFCPPVATVDVMWLLSPWLPTDASTNCTLLGPLDCDSFYKWIPLSRWPGCHLIRGIAFYLLCISSLYYIFITLRVVCPPRSERRWALLPGQVWCSVASQEHQWTHPPPEAVTHALTHTHVSSPILSSFVFVCFTSTHFFAPQKWISNPNFSLTNL